MRIPLRILTLSALVAWPASTGDLSAQEASPSPETAAATGANTDISIGIQLFDEGKQEEALARFSKAIAADPGLAEAYYYRSVLHVSLTGPEEATADMQKYLELAPDGPHAAEVKELLAALKTP